MNARTKKSRLWQWLPLFFVIFGILELVILILIGVYTRWWWPLLIIAINWIIAAALVITAGQQAFSRVRSLIRAVRGNGDVQQHMSRPAFTLLAALAFAYPGVLSDVIGVILLLTPVQRRTVSAVGMGSASQGANRVLYRQARGGVIDGEIVVTAERSGSSAADSHSHAGGSSADARTDATAGEERLLSGEVIDPKQPR